MTTDEFRKFCTVAALSIPHDWAVLAPGCPDKLDVRLFSTADAANPNAEEDLSSAAEDA